MNDGFYNFSKPGQISAQSASYALTASYALNGGGTPGGLDTNIQFNLGSTFAGTSSFSFNYQSQSLQQGLLVTASGLYSHAEGDSTVAYGDYSHTSGRGTIASGSAQTVVGQYNKRGNTTDLFVVGGGTGDADANRKDVFNVSTTNIIMSGSVNISGSLLVNGNTPATIKAGYEQGPLFGGRPLTGSITFSTAFPNSNYSVTVIGEEDARVWSIQSKTSGSFVINSNSSEYLIGRIYWTATPFSNS